MPGFYIAENLTSGPFLVQLFTPGGGGKTIAIPQAEALDVYTDGIDFKFRNLGRIGSYMDLATYAVPGWILACTVPPYLVCDGSTFNATTYPALNAMLGGNTLPDLRGRLRATLDQGTGNITIAGSGVDGTTLLSIGGLQNQAILRANLPNYNLPLNDPGHFHTTSPILSGGPNFGAGAYGASGMSFTSTEVTRITVQLGGSSTPLPIMPPVTITGITLIRAA